MLNLNQLAAEIARSAMTDAGIDGGSYEYFDVAALAAHAVISKPDRTYVQAKIAASVAIAKASKTTN